MTSNKSCLLNSCALLMLAMIMWTGLQPPVNRPSPALPWLCKPTNLIGPWLPCLLLSPAVSASAINCSPCLSIWANLALPARCPIAPLPLIKGSWPALHPHLQASPSSEPSLEQGPTRRLMVLWREKMSNLQCTPVSTSLSVRSVGAANVSSAQHLALSPPAGCATSVAFALPRASSIMALVSAVLRASSTTAPLMMKTTALMSPAPAGLALALSAGQPWVSSPSSYPACAATCLPVDASISASRAMIASGDQAAAVRGTPTLCAEKSLLVVRPSPRPRRSLYDLLTKWIQSFLLLAPISNANASSLKRGRRSKVAKARASPILFLQCQGNGQVHPGAGCLVLSHSIYPTPLQPFRTPPSQPLWLSWQIQVIYRHEIWTLRTGRASNVEV